MAPASLSVVVGGLLILVGTALLSSSLRFSSRLNYRFTLWGFRFVSSIAEDGFCIVLCYHVFYITWNELQQRGRFETMIQDSPIAEKLSRMVPNYSVGSLVSETVSYARTLVSRYSVSTPPPQGHHRLIWFVVEPCVPNDSLYQGERDMIPYPPYPVFDSPSRSRERIVASLAKVKINDRTWKEESCAVCRDKFQDTEDVFAISCQHAYHENCIVQWLQQSNRCPVCRFEIPGM